MDFADPIKSQQEKEVPMPDEPYGPSFKPQPGAAPDEQTREDLGLVGASNIPWSSVEGVPLAKAGEFGIVTPEMLRDAEHEAGEDIPETEEQAYALYDRRAAALTRLLAAAGRAASGAQVCPICLGRTKVPAGFYGGVGATWASSTTKPETCRSCNGKGYLAAAPAPAQLSEDWLRSIMKPEIEAIPDSLLHNRSLVANTLISALLRSQPAGTQVSGATGAAKDGDS